MVEVAGCSLTEWNAFITRSSVANNCEERLSYRKIGGTGFINACSFDLKPKGKYSFDSVKAKIDTIFKQVKADGVTKLVIDVSQNEGGNSLVGDYLISNIYNKPYKGYRTDWKRSDEYLALLKLWGIEKPDYAAQPVGKVIIYPSDEIVPTKVPYPFKGQTMVLIGKSTFSSAMNFATLVKDNHIAALIGQIPINGHPSGFGEIFYTNLPHTQVFVRFGVKEYVRPAGKSKDNNLVPDNLLSDIQMNTIDDLLRQNKL
jgi:ribosomal protein L35AE/L33A